jgi:protein O-GlcNAc transferase
LGNALKALGRLDEAAASYRKAIATKPNNAEAYNNLGNLLEDMNKLSDAITCYQKTLILIPDHVDALNNLGSVFRNQGKFEQAVDCYKKALELKPDYSEVYSNLLFTLQYDPSQDMASLLEAHRNWGRLSGASGARKVSHTNNRAPERKLRVGYVSADFGRHPVGYFLLPVLASHNRSRFEVFCYSDRCIEDDLTCRLRDASDSWRTVFGISHSALDEMIRADGIDILVDLAGHTGHNRLLTFARKPAPVQVTWAGYVGTTGLSAIDYIISDWRETPEGADQWYVEKIERLPDGYVCYDPPDYAPAVSSLPAKENGFVTFGSFNNLPKVNPGVIALWSKLLQQLPGSRLLMLTKQLGDTETRGRYRKMFAELGVADRVEFCGALPHRDLLAKYGAVDIALDTFPYSGGLTTLESLWMGVPVVTLGGVRFASRHSVSHLTTAGVPELITEGAEEYLSVAISLAQDLKRLEDLRMGLRQRVAESPLCDGQRFTLNLEAAYRKMWGEWCAGYLDHKWGVWKKIFCR